VAHARKNAEGNAGRRKARVSIEDVARQANVSVATVSRVLNNPALVAPATAERVQRVIGELKYRPNLFAQGLMTRRSKVLAIALPDIFGEFYSELLRGADTAAREQGYHLLVSSEARLNRAEGPSSHLAFGLVDGLAMMLTEPNEELIEEALGGDRALVALDVDLRDRGIDSVVMDNGSGTREAVQHLLESTPAASCHFAGGPRENFDSNQRLAAFSEALSRAGQPVADDRVSFGDFSVECGERWFDAWRSSDGPTPSAVLAANDEIAYGIMLSAQRAGVDVPRELRIVGFDNSRLSAIVRPGLTSVRIPVHDAGETAIRMLIERLDDAEREPRRVVLPTTLVVRETSVVGK
jgi:LacI family transcriptional regulator